MKLDSKIYVAGHRGMVGSAIVRELQRQGYTNIITRTHAELDLTNALNTYSWLPQRLVASLPTRVPWPISCTTT